MKKRIPIYAYVQSTAELAYQMYNVLEETILNTQTYNQGTGVQGRAGAENQGGR